MLVLVLVPVLALVLVLVGLALPLALLGLLAPDRSHAPPIDPRTPPPPPQHHALPTPPPLIAHCLCSPPPLPPLRQATVAGLSLLFASPRSLTQSFTDSLGQATSVFPLRHIVRTLVSHAAYFGDQPADATLASAAATAAPIAAKHKNGQQQFAPPPVRASILQFADFLFRLRHHLDSIAAAASATATAASGAAAAAHSEQQQQQEQRVPAALTYTRGASDRQQQQRAGWDYSSHNRLFVDVLTKADSFDVDGDGAYPSRPREA